MVHGGPIVEISDAQTTKLIAAICSSVLLGLRVAGVQGATGLTGKHPMSNKEIAEESIEFVITFEEVFDSQ